MNIDHTGPASAGAGTLPEPAGRSLALVRACGLAPQDPILAVGDVDAQLLLALHELGHTDITLLQPSLAALQRLREALGELKHAVLLEETGLLGFHPRRRYALWHDSGVFGRLRHAEDRHRYVQLAQFSLRPEGHLIISTQGLEGADREHGASVERYSAPRLAAELGGQFELMDQVLVLGGEEHARDGQRLHCRFQRHAPVWNELAEASGTAG
jgi:hypothetical protein